MQFQTRAAPPIKSAGHKENHRNMPNPTIRGIIFKQDNSEQTHPLP
jgi:hypothetical protein